MEAFHELRLRNELLRVINERIEWSPCVDDLRTIFEDSYIDDGNYDDYLSPLCGIYVDNVIEAIEKLTELYDHTVKLIIQNLEFCYCNSYHTNVNKRMVLKALYDKSKDKEHFMSMLKSDLYHIKQVPLFVKVMEAKELTTEEQLKYFDYGDEIHGSLLEILYSLNNADLHPRKHSLKQILLQFDIVDWPMKIDNVTVSENTRRKEESEHYPYHILKHLYEREDFDWFAKINYDSDLLYYFLDRYIKEHPDEKHVRCHLYINENGYFDVNFEK